MEIKVLIADQECTFAAALAARVEGEEDIRVAETVQIKTPDQWPSRVITLSFTSEPERIAPCLG